MIIIKVELWSAITGKTTELARMSIVNDGFWHKSLWELYWLQFIEAF